MRFIACFAFLLALAPFAVAAEQDGGAISGTVVGADGKPIADMVVKVFNAKAPRQEGNLADPPAAPGMDAVAETKTANDGTFKFENLNPGGYMVIAGDLAKGIGRAPANVQRGKTVEVKITIRKRRIG